LITNKINGGGWQSEANRSQAKFPSTAKNTGIL
jgi:hypothetical protein